ncbi:hypothetical protein OEZ86_007823 [Tetradesmus obliquus]|nr:hypothetical protein OEZ86_007823 [Tetradesmus obliquus]
MRPSQGGSLKPAPLLLYLSFNIILIGYSFYMFYWTPPPKPSTASASQFSEQRARGHVHMLAEEIGLRSVATPGLQAAHRYIWQFSQQLQQQAAGSGIVVQAAFENYTGSFDFDFVGERFVNAYHNISNIMLQVSRQGSEQQPAVLLVAHHDSPVGSPGAGDDASNVGVMMELASNLVAGGAANLPASPVMFLFSGAEEPLCQSAAAFMASSSWASRVGCFINLESIGPGGSPIVFQHAGAWTIEAYAKGAAYPRGAIVAQDIFDAGLVLGDTDFRQLSYLHRGGLPGIDVAYLLAGAAYHTDRDTLAAIRPGVLQETGDSLTGAIRSLADTLAAAAASSSPSDLQQLLKPSKHKQMFMAIGATHMITYSTAAAATLHNVPLVMALSAPAVLQLLAPATALPVADALRVMSKAAGISCITFVSTMAVPAACGALRAWATGRPMVWFAHPIVAFLSYLPISIAVLLLPWSHMNYDSPQGQQLLPYHMLGGALLNSLVAAVLTRFGVGLALIFAMWSGFGVLAALAMARGFSMTALLGALLATALPIYCCAETALVLLVVLISRMSLTGHIFSGLGDAIVGVLLGLGAVSLPGSSLLPVVQAMLGRHSRRVIAALLALALLAAAVASSGLLWPYSKEMPKRLMLGHVHYTAAAADAAAAAGTDGPVPMRVVNSSWVIASSDSIPAGVLSDAMGFNRSEAQAPTGNEWGMIYPVSKLLDLELFPAEPAAGVVGHLPHVKLLATRPVPHPHNRTNAAAAAAALTEAHFEIFTEKPCWATFKISGVDIARWSLFDGEGWTEAAAFIASQQRGSGSSIAKRKKGAAGIAVDVGEDWGDGVVRNLVVKWTSEQQQAPLRWPVRVQYYSKQQQGASRAGRDEQQHQQQQEGRAGEQTGSSSSIEETGLSVELHVGYVERTAKLAAVQARMPEWSTLTYEATIYISSWDF